MSNNIVKKSIINQDELNQKYYFKSLIEEAYFKKVLSDEDLITIQVNSFNLLKKVIGRLTANESFTVKYSRAKELFESMCFNISVYLKTINPDDAILELLNNDWYEIFLKGNNLIQEYKNKYKKFYYLLKINMLPITNYDYIDTFFNDIDKFFKLYNKDFDATNKIILASYPLFSSNPDLLGIEFIMKYMDGFNIENLFLQKLDIDDINNLINRINIKEETINIFEIILFIIIGEELNNHQEYHLNLNVLEVENIYMNLSKKDEDEREMIIKSVLKKTYNKLDCNETIINYIEKYFNYIINRINKNIENDTLDLLFSIK